MHAICIFKTPLVNNVPFVLDSKLILTFVKKEIVNVYLSNLMNPAAGFLENPIWDPKQKVSGLHTESFWYVSTL